MKYKLTNSTTKMWAVVNKKNGKILILKKTKGEAKIFEIFNPEFIQALPCVVTLITK